MKGGAESANALQGEEKRGAVHCTCQKENPTWAVVEIGQATQESTYQLDKKGMTLDF